MLYIVLSSMLIAVSVVALFMPRVPAAALAYGAMWVALAGGVAYFTASTMVFWGIATVLVLAINRLLPRSIASAKDGLSHMAIGAIAGMSVGATMNSRGAIIIGTAIGCLLGGVAYANSATGRTQMRFPSSQFFNYLAAKGLPIVVALSMAAEVLVQFVQIQS